MRRENVISICMGALAIGGALALFFPGWVRYRLGKKAMLCRDNLRLIDGAIEQWARDKKNATDTATWNELIKGGYLKEIPVCPGIGTTDAYSIEPYAYGAGGARGHCKLGMTAGHDLVVLEQAGWDCVNRNADDEKAIRECFQRIR